MTIKRRQYLTEEGEPLLLARSAIDVPVRFEEWVEDTGMNRFGVISDPLCSVPLPRYNDANITGQHRWKDVDPAMLWHPLFWLPERLATRHTLTDDVTGEKIIETDAMWAVRVGLELTVSGLYDPIAGWVDILATVGLDADDQLDQWRLQEWLDGGADEVLDNIDLASYLDLDDLHWASESVPSLMPHLRPASWALLADDLLRICDDLYDPTNFTITDQEVELLAGTTVEIAAALLSEVPDEGGPELRGFWESQREIVSENILSADDLLSGPMERVSDALRSIRDQYWSKVVLISHLADSPNTPETADFQGV